MTREEFDYVVSVYEEIIETQLLYPDKIRKAHMYLTGTDQVSVKQAKQVIYAWYNYQREKAFEALDNVFGAADEESSVDVSNVSVYEEDVDGEGDTSSVDIVNEDVTKTNIDENNESINVDSPSHNEDTTVTNHEDTEKENKKETNDESSPSHNEDTTVTNHEDTDKGDEEREMLLEISQLENEYEKQTNSNVRRSIKMKINHLKKKLNE